MHDSAPPLQYPVSMDPSTGVVRLRKFLFFTRCREPVLVHKINRSGIMLEAWKKRGHLRKYFSNFNVLLLFFFRESRKQKQILARIRFLRLETKFINWKFLFPNRISYETQKNLIQWIAKGRCWNENEDERREFFLRGCPNMAVIELIRRLELRKHRLGT